MNFHYNACSRELVSEAFYVETCGEIASSSAVTVQLFVETS